MDESCEDAERGTEDLHQCAGGSQNQVPEYHKKQEKVGSSRWPDPMEEGGLLYKAWKDWKVWTPCNVELSRVQSFLQERPQKGCVLLGDERRRWKHKVLEE